MLSIVVCVGEEGKEEKQKKWGGGERKNSKIHCAPISVKIKNKCKRPLGTTLPQGAYLK